MKISAPRFDVHECRNEAEFRFLQTLHSRAAAREWHADAWSRDDRLLLTVDITDHEYNTVLRTLRVDLVGSTLLAGPDETHQLTTDLDPGSANVVRIPGGTPEVLATAAADWLEQEMARPIERWEWNRVTFRHRLWQCADTGEHLVWSDSENKKRSDLGSPDRVVALDVVLRPRVAG
jgi:hypothetical protein